MDAMGIERAPLVGILGAHIVAHAGTRAPSRAGPGPGGALGIVPITKEVAETIRPTFKCANASIRQQASFRYS